MNNLSAIAHKSRCYKINVFSTTKNTGNPASVVITPTPLTLETKQTLASRFGTPETAFVTKISGVNALEFFTPKTQVQSCGHATLAAAYAVSLSQPQIRTDITFQIAGQLIRVIRSNSFENRFTLLETPWKMESVGRLPYELSESLSFESQESEFFNLSNTGARYRCAVKLPNSETLFQLNPNMNNLAAFLLQQGLTGCFAFVYNLNEKDKLTGRFFGPNIGLDEDIFNGNSAIASYTLANYVCKAANQRPPAHLFVSQGHKFGHPCTASVEKRIGLANTIIGLEAELCLYESNIL